MPTRYDIIVFGATSFVGKIICRYLVETYGASLPWAAAARSRPKLDDLKRELNVPDLPILVADATDVFALKGMCEQTRVIVSTVGPYALYGEPLIRSCAETGTDYCDLAGEPQWIMQMIQRYESVATATGARIVNCCGFDSIPSDLGVYLLQQAAQVRFGQACQSVKMRVVVFKGALSGGTVLSLLNAVKAATEDSEAKRALTNPFALCPETDRPRSQQPSVRFVEWDGDVGSWIAPFIMALINIRIVHRTNALLGNAWGDDFVYDEALASGPGFRGALEAVGTAAGLAAIWVGGTYTATRQLLARVLPKPGEGPSRKAQEAGCYDLRFMGRTRDGRCISARVQGDRDPGYGSSAKIISQAALLLAQETPKGEPHGGFWTPASLFGSRLAPRLQNLAGVVFEVFEGGSMLYPAAVPNLPAR